MERYNHSPLDDEEKLDKTRGSETSKKKKKKPTKAPLPVKKPQLFEKQADKEKEQPRKEKKPKQPLAEEDKTKLEETKADAEAPVEALELPEVEEPEVEYQGELVIDHAEEEIQAEAEPVAEALELPEPEELVIEHAEAEARQENAPNTPTVPEVPPPFIFNLPPSVAAEREEIADPQLDSTDAWQDRLPTNPTFAGEAMVDPSLRRAAVSTEQAEPVITPEQAHNQSYRAEKRGLGRGVVSGGLMGWWLGLRSKRAMEREMNDQLEGHERAIEGLKTELVKQQDLTEQRLGAAKRTQEQLRRLTERNWEQKLRTKTDAKPEAFKSPVEQNPGYEPAKQPEKITPVIEKRPEKHVEEKPEQIDAYLPPEGRHFEASAWHKIEVDDKTGRAVEAPSIEYGKAFVQEQQQERLAHSAAKAQTAAQVGVTLLSSDNNTASPISAPAPILPPKPKQSNKIVAALKDTEFIRSELMRNSTSPGIWLSALLIVVLLILLGVF